MENEVSSLCSQERATGPYLERKALSTTPPRSPIFNVFTVAGANLFARDPLEVKGKGIREVTGNEAYTVHTINVISQRQ
jgi:hypothetical protein